MGLTQVEYPPCLSGRALTGWHTSCSTNLLSYMSVIKPKAMACQFSYTSLCTVLPLESKFSNDRSIACLKYSNTRIYHRKVPKNLRNARRSKLPPDFGVNLFLKKPTVGTDLTQANDADLTDEDEEAGEVDSKEEHGEIVWESEEIEAISSLFQGRIPQKPGNLSRERPLPLPLPYKLRPLGLPTQKKHVKTASPRVSSFRASITKQIYKKPSFLISLAKRMKTLNANENVSLVLDDCAHFLRKGSLSLTIRELGHMGAPERALQTFCWAQKQPLLYPDDRILAATIEVLARHRDLKVPLNLHNLTNLASQQVIEAMVRGLIRGGNLRLARKLLLVAKRKKRTLHPGIYAKLILEIGKDPDKHLVMEALLKELGEREDLNLSLQDCTAVMKICIKLGRFDVVETLFNWFKQSGHEPSIVMYTTLIHSRCSEKKYREALAVVWEMEGSNCLFDLPAYRVVIKLFVALNDLSRTVRYFSKLKEAGFSPTYDIYRDLISIYMVSGRLAKCKEITREAEMAGFKFEKQIQLGLSQLEKETRLGL